MPSADWEMGHLGFIPPPHGGGGGGGHHHGGGGTTVVFGGPGYGYGWPGFYEEPWMLPLVSTCPLGTVAETQIDGAMVCKPVPKLSGMGQLNPVIQSIASAAGFNPANFQKDAQNLEKNVEMYVYAQLGLQTVATAATFGLFLMMFYKFMRDKKKGTL